MAIFHTLNSYRNTGILIIRVGLGAMMIYHGYPKLLGGPELWTGLGSSTRYVGITFLPTLFGFLAAATECIGGLLFLIGLWFRPVCLLLVINLAVAAATHFGKGEGMGAASHAIELAIVFLGFFIIGPGRYSVDKK